MRKYIILLSFIGIIVLLTGCEATPPNPILLDENFEDGTINSELGCYSPSDLFIPKIVQDGDNSVLQLSS